MAVERASTNVVAAFFISGLRRDAPSNPVGKKRSDCVDLIARPSHVLQLVRVCLVAGQSNAHQHFGNVTMHERSEFV